MTLSSAEILRGKIRSISQVGTVEESVPIGKKCRALGILFEEVFAFLLALASVLSFGMIFGQLNCPLRSCYPSMFSADIDCNCYVASQLTAYLTAGNGSFTDLSLKHGIKN